jgi:hypothetical protein
MNAFDQAFALLKMPIDWDTVTEPTFTRTQRTGLDGEKIDYTDGEASAQWIHPNTGERYDIRMDKWIQRPLEMTQEDLERLMINDPYPHTRTSGSLTVTQPMSEEKADTLAEVMDTTREVMAEYGDDQERWGGTDFYSNTDPFGRRDLQNASRDERAVPMPDLPSKLQGLGLGTDMYDLLTHWGVKLKPDWSQSPQARRMWLRNAGFDRDVADTMSNPTTPRGAYRALINDGDYTWRGHDERN